MTDHIRLRGISPAPAAKFVPLFMRSPPRIDFRLLRVNLHPEMCSRPLSIAFHRLWLLTSMEMLAAVTLGCLQDFDAAIFGLGVCGLAPRGFGACGECLRAGSICPPCCSRMALVGLVPILP